VFIQVGFGDKRLCHVNLLQSVCWLQVFDKVKFQIWSVQFVSNGKYANVFGVTCHQKSVVILDVSESIILLFWSIANAVK
jgi:hypothetical protein